MKGYICMLGIILLSWGSAHAQTRTVYLSSEENSFFEMINEFRRELKLPELEIHLYLQNAAEAHSNWMEGQNYLSHYESDGLTPIQRMVRAGYVHPMYTGENVACGYGDAGATFVQWATSPGHLENMVNPHYRHLGVSRKGNGDEKCPFYWTTDFGSNTDPKNDPDDISDESIIQAAVKAVSGVDAVTLLPHTGTAPAPRATPSPAPRVTPTPVPAPVITPRPIPSSTPKPTPVPAPVVSSEDGSIQSLQCMIPYDLGRGVLAFNSNLDTMLEAKASSSGATVKLSYFQDSAPTTFMPVNLNNVSMIANPDFPLVTVFVAPSRVSGGFMLQLNTKTKQAHFDSYNVSPAQSGSVTCSIKTN